ncbi:hypothetical protein SAMN05421805_119114 [Saccharopolyspora antimicrobica]|uniref:Uncharacterized protein n=1 Tax=Saccharopolyspora antimicrobica TaxID=455193 RepID=A0A1I5IR76_9PSEU|nr:hypothetical protein [Saccharopolyspora antimicrobica]RKT84132.1 hypothetical protein ATL45_2435 [Saccharopolyspora antimicrobica]SFO63078.1 hypothetical protein SAMN05421805_119114 [Saccharopolyspora antimicrobica]
MISDGNTTAPIGARILVALATCAVLVPWSLFCAVLVGLSAMCTDDFDSSDCAETMSIPIALGVLGLVLAAVQLIVALRGRTTKSVLLRGIPALALAPAGLFALYVTFVQ